MTTATEVLPQIEETESDFDGKAHYVRIKALVQGGPQVALCGKKYTPKIVGAAVMDLPICESCKELMSILEVMNNG